MGPSRCRGPHQRPSPASPVVSQISDVSVLGNNRSVTGGAPAAISDTDVIAAGLLARKQPALWAIHS